MIYITGDTHGKFEHVEDFCYKNKTSRNDTLIILGDACINYFEDYRDDIVKQELSKLPITLFCVHGNHESRPYHIDTYKVLKKYGGLAYVESEFPNLIFAIDGEIYDFNNKKCIVCGGAYSVDKKFRIASGRPWFSDEQPNDIIKKKISNKLSRRKWTIDTVLSHTCPLKYEPIEMFLAWVDQSTVDKSTEIFLDTIEDKLTYNAWWCGHYHLYKKIDNLTFLFNDIVEFN